MDGAGPPLTSPVASTGGVDVPVPPAGPEPLPPFLENKPRSMRVIDRLGALLGTSYMVTTVLLVLFLYAVDGAVAAYYGYFDDFAHLVVGPVLFIGVLMVICIIEWTRVRYRRILWTWRRHFGDEYPGRLEEHWAHLCDDRRMLVATVPTALLLVGYIALVRLGLVNSILPVTGVEQPFLLGPPALFLILVLLLTIGGYFVGMGVYIVWELTTFTRTLASVDLRHFQLLSSETSLGDLAWLTAIMSALWFVGVALATVVTSQNFDLLSFAVYGGAITIGISLFFVPQWYLHKSILRGKERLVQQLRSGLPSGWRVDPAVRHDDRTMALLTLIRQVDSVNDWPVDVWTTISLVAGMLIPVALTVLVNVLAASAR